MIKLQQKQFNSIQMELSRKIKNISTLFNEVSNQLKDNEDIKSSRKKLNLFIEAYVSIVLKVRFVTNQMSIN